MIKSMTGFGREERITDEVSIIVEIKTLNSKNFDLLTRIPKTFSEKEVEIRNMLEKHLQRGKISINIEYQNNSKSSIPQAINRQLFINYYTQLKEMSMDVNAKDDDLFRIALFMPDVIVPDINPSGEVAYWPLLKEVIQEAIYRCDEFRINEGLSLESEFQQYIHSIEQNLKEIEILDPERIEQIKVRIKTSLQELMADTEWDKNRFEQELIYYIEKLDISEEKVRLQNHLTYFLYELGNDNSNGKKLNFISQEIGREINTIGSKANYSAITQKVVLMKDSLEKIKEQLLNIL